MYGICFHSVDQNTIINMTQSFVSVLILNCPQFKFAYILNIRTLHLHSSSFKDINISFIMINFIVRNICNLSKFGSISMKVYFIKRPYVTWIEKGSWDTNNHKIPLRMVKSWILQVAVSVEVSILGNKFLEWEPMLATVNHQVMRNSRNLINMVLRHGAVSDSQTHRELQEIGVTQTRGEEKPVQRSMPHCQPTLPSSSLMRLASHFSQEKVGTHTWPSREVSPSSSYSSDSPWCWKHHWIGSWRLLFFPIGKGHTGFLLLAHKNPRFLDLRKYCTVWWRRIHRVSVYLSNVLIHG